MSGTTDPADGASSDPEAVYERLATEIDRVLVGNDDAVEYLTVALLIRGHLLLEGVPGVAKTTLANLFARTTGLDHNRIQMTPDTLPADITGTRIYRQNRGTFDLQRGPVFANLVVADEINRATPKTQSALLEAMEERRVTIEGETLPLPDPFMVVATQNPIEAEGVSPLPEAQRDRFHFKLVIDLPERTAERELLDRFDDAPNLGADDVSQVIEPQSIADARRTVQHVHVAPPVKEYALDLVTATREHASVSYGASPRASLAFLNGSKARAAIHGRDYVIPDDVKALAEPVLRHRLVLNTDAELSAIEPTDVVAEIVDAIEPPGADVPGPDEPRAASDGGSTPTE
ncbi:MoxR family ATPase [Natrinema sp. 1APR25-10V2]|uniref:AAA family ATPase n=1 Tax=Natrinema sp. 1APR25-10V2 TaxID=2951081 RepID=UPI0028745D1A|nr:MoxR family ATPase [Natrinema sp. 1APR25-10V2]MDS0475730.1 MoxR family ATPase [Natrinema sp. 1APR25-10V2]